MYKEISKKFDNSNKHHREITKIWREYNKELTGSDFIGENIFNGILKNQPYFQSEILNIMFNAGYKKAMEVLSND